MLFHQNYIEKNKVEFSQPAYVNCAGMFNKNFQLPVGGLNCNGDLEFVITCIVYFEDCTICYQSKAFDYHTTFNWIWDDKVIGVKKADYIKEF